jgi:uncharacterized caspase-like protein
MVVLGMLPNLLMGAAMLRIFGRLGGFCALVGLAVSAVTLSANAQAGRRVALVIGNTEYAHTRVLPNARNDARDIAGELTRMGFTVRVHADLAHQPMRDALHAFGRFAANSDVALVYFAGHGLEVAGQNWLVPVSAQLAHERDLPYEAINLDLMLQAVAGAGQLRLVILDACRNNPLNDKIELKAGTTRGSARGLGRVDPSGDVMVAYSAKHGTVAEDGRAGTNSPFAAALMEHMATPGLDVRLLFGRVIDSVRQATNSRQEPFTYGSVGGREVALMPVDRVSDGAKFQRPAAPPPAPSVDAAWRQIENSRDARDFDAFRRQFGSANPFFDREAEKKLDTIAEDRRRATTEANAKDDELRRKADALKVKEQELAEATLKLKEQELEQRNQQLERDRQRLNRVEPVEEEPTDRGITPVRPSGPTRWYHNGSQMRLAANGASRQFYYDNPRQGMREQGVGSGELLFDGSRDGTSYSGTAHVFKRGCKKAGYQVNGNVAEDQRTVVMTGRAPIMDGNCQVRGYRDDELVFELMAGQ